VEMLPLAKFNID